MTVQALDLINGITIIADVQPTEFGWQCDKALALTLQPIEGTKSARPHLIPISFPRAVCLKEEFYNIEIQTAQVLGEPWSVPEEIRVMYAKKTLGIIQV